MALPGTTNRNLTNAQNVVKPSNFTRSVQPPASTRYDPAPAPNPLRLQAENSYKQYQPPKSNYVAPRQVFKPILPPAKLTTTKPQGLDYNKFNEQVQQRAAEQQQSSNSAKTPSSLAPLPTAKNNDSQLSELGKTLRRLSQESVPSALREGSEGLRDSGALTALDLAERAIKATGYDIDESTPESRANNSRLRDEFSKGISNTATGIGNSLNDLGQASRNAFDNLFDRLADPFKKHPRTDPKNNDGRPRPQHIGDFSEYQIREYWDVAQHSTQSIASIGANYTTGESGKWDGRHPDHWRFQNQDEDSQYYVKIYWTDLASDNLGFSGPFYTRDREGIAEVGTISQTTTPQFPTQTGDVPLLTPPGTIPDPGYPPIFTEDDFKPQRKQNDEQAKQDEADRQSAPNQEQSRQSANQEAVTPTPSPWNHPIPTPQPIPAPYPYPLDAPTETTAPDATPEDRLKDTLGRLKDALEQIAPSPQNQEPRTETTINGEPVSTRRPFPAPVRSPVSTPTETPGTNVTINGVPETRLNPPLPDTRVNQPTTVKAPVEPRIDPTTGIAPKTEPTPTTPATPGKCEDPCMQGLHDKLDQKSSVSLTVKVFKSCSKPVAEGQMPETGVETEDKIIKVPADQTDTYKLLYAQLLTIESAQCDASAVASVPEWWKPRRGSDTPQLAIIFAEVFKTGKLGDGRWTLSIPHYAKPKGFKPSVPGYAKGNFQGILKLNSTDGTKIVVNAGSDSECKRMINKLKILIPVNFRVKNGKAIRPRVTQDPDGTLKQCQVVPIRGDFYSKGQLNSKPDWSIDLRKRK